MKYSNTIAANSTIHRIGEIGLDATLVVIFAIATAAAAHIAAPVPGTPVPMTLQSAVVLLSGLVLGSRRGALSQLAYLGGGIAGLPFFASITGPVTWGYLIGFVLAAWCTGTLNNILPGKGLGRAWFAALLGSAALFIPGVIVLKFSLAMSWNAALAAGVAPFLIWDVLKVSAATAVYAVIRR